MLTDFSPPKIHSIKSNTKIKEQWIYPAYNVVSTPKAAALRRSSPAVLPRDAGHEIPRRLHHGGYVGRLQHLEVRRGSDRAGYHSEKRQKALRRPD